MAISSWWSSSQAFAASIASWTLWYSAMSFSLSASDISPAIFSFSSSKRESSARVPATASSTFPSTSLAGFRRGSCGRKPTRIPSAGKASPAKSFSTPAMMRRTVDLPAPFNPRTPIFAPGKKEREIPFRISRCGGTTFRSLTIV